MKPILIFSLSVVVSASGAVLFPADLSLAAPFLAARSQAGLFPARLFQPALPPP